MVRGKKKEYRPEFVFAHSYKFLPRPVGFECYFALWLLTEQSLKRDAVGVLEGVAAVGAAQLPPGFFDAAVLESAEAGPLEVRVNSRRRLTNVLSAMRGR